jgi:hypothetical protein
MNEGFEQFLATIIEQCLDEYNMQPPLVIHTVGDNGSVLVAGFNEGAELVSLTKHCDNDTFTLPIKITVVSQNNRNVRFVIGPDGNVGWSCGFQPGCDQGEQKHGIGKNFEEARLGFQAAWEKLLPKKTEAHFELWRQNRDQTAWKYRMWEEKCRMPSQTTDGRSQCFCGEWITQASIPKHVREAHRGIGGPKTEN